MAEERRITYEELAQHKSPQSLWLLVHGRVYDVTPYLSQHPGGFSYLFRSGGKDVTGDFEAFFHSERARTIMKQFEIGIIEGANAQTLSMVNNRPNGHLFLHGIAEDKKSSKSSSTKKKEKVIRTKTPTDFELIEKSFVTKSMNVYRFKVPNGRRLDCPIGHHISIVVKDGDKVLKREYTPIVDKKGYFDLLIKTYKTGNLSEYLSYLEEGETVPMMGPFGEWQYIDGAYQRLVMFAAGSGVTPMYRIISHVLRRDDVTEMTLLFANRTEKDVPLKKKFEAWAEEAPEQFTVHYLYSQPIKEAKNTGRVSADIVRATVAPNAARSGEFVLVCGPDGFMESVRAILASLEYPLTRVHFF